MRVRELAIGDRLINDRGGAVYIITEIGGYHGDEISFSELHNGRIRRCRMTVRQFERLRYLRRAPSAEAVAHAAMLCSAAASNVGSSKIFESVGYGDDKASDALMIVGRAFESVRRCASCRAHGHIECRLEWSEAEARIMNGEIR